MSNARRALALTSTLYGLVVCVAAVVPGPAWSPGSAELSDAPVLTASRVLHAQTGLTVSLLERGVEVTTGDGGGTGRIDGLDAHTVRVRPASFRGAVCWEIGTEAGRPATYIDDNGVRLDDGMTDRLRTRAWPLPALLTLLAVVLAVMASRAPLRISRWAALVVLLLATIALASTLA